MQCMSPEQGFLGLEPKDAVNYSDAKAVIIPFGLEATVSYGGGTAKGPAAMIKASHEVELFDEQLWCEPFRQIGVVTLEEPKISSQIEVALDQLESLVERVLADGKFPMTFGGEHSITAATIRPFLKKYPNLAILHFDAHADLRDGFEGEHYSHASALRRCLDDDNVELVSCGIRNISAEEIPFLEDNRDRIHIYWGKDKKRWNIDEIVSHLKDRPVYLTFDVDGFDASLMPATGTPEPGGLFWEDVLDIMTAASKVSTIVGADVNELAPVSHLHSCDFLAAKLAYKILSLAFARG
ncbi:agmatinase [Candidiatus Paracoxiella cheracis]|uniref:agmatinase n=1 Tax=Candidiatus Paracoxiella cheracis TaxID=3405120 RepID=UPI003BF4B71E